MAPNKDPTAPELELHRGEPKVISVHSIGNLNSTPRFSYFQDDVFFRSDNLALMTYRDM